jgi:type IX secretion system PorP/SprF family membrane protein
MKKLKNSILILWVFFVLQGSAQDFPYHYFSNSVPVVTNPSLVAATSDISISVGTYNLWAGGFNPVNDYLVSLAVSPDYFRRRNNRRNSTRIGLGLNLLNDRIGPFNHYILQLIYAYHIPLSRNVQLSLGVSGIIENMNIDVNSLSPGQPEDPRLLTGNNLSFLFDGGFGASILTENFVLGLSILNLAPGTFRFSEEPFADFTSYRKIFLSGSSIFNISQLLQLKPHVTLRNSNTEWLNFDSSLGFQFQHFGVGAGYRSENSLFLFLNIPFKGFILSYTSENPLNSNPMMGNGHTFTLGWKPGELIR